MASLAKELEEAINRTGVAVGNAIASTERVIGVIQKDMRIEAKNTSVELWRTNEPIKFAGGYGGHPTASRPKRKALTIWEGRAPFQGTVPALLWSSGDSIEAERISLEGMAVGGDNSQPQAVKIEGQNIPIPATVTNSWWIEDIQWGEEVKRKSDWAAVFKLCTLTLLERVDDEVLGSSTLRSRIGNNSTVKHYVVKKGDTLASIAATQLHDKTRWQDIAVLNGLRSTGQLKVGMRLTLP